MSGSLKNSLSAELMNDIVRSEILSICVDSVRYISRDLIIHCTLIRLKITGFDMDIKNRRYNSDAPY